MYRNINATRATNLKVGVLTASDTRTPDNDKSGQLIKQMFETAGHRVAILRESCAMMRIVSRAQSSKISRSLDAMIITGGTGVAPRDRTADIVKKLLDTELPGFGELFRMLSYRGNRIGRIREPRDRGNARGQFIAALPGSTGGCRLAMEKLILPGIGHLVDLANPLAKPK